MTTMSRRAFLTQAAAGAVGGLSVAGVAGTLLAGYDAEQTYDVEGVIVFKYGHGEIQANKASDFTFGVNATDGYRWDVPVSEHEYRRHNEGDRIKATGTDGNVWMVSR